MDDREIQRKEAGDVEQALVYSAAAVEEPQDLSAYYGQLYESYATDVLRMCYFYLADRQKAEDVVQDVFVRLMTTNPVLQPGKEKSWLLKVAMNRCRDLWRGAWLKRVVLGSPVFELIPAADEYAQIGEKQEMMNAINHLPAMFKEVILLHYYQGYGISEISDMMGLPEGTISSRLSRARKKLEELLLKGGEEQ
ncbi:MAG: RNA polymerase sigma factor [Clostridia bacterium]|nr:RNA polymerase sigma factor [Clostridia bacterium]